MGATHRIFNFIHLFGQLPVANANGRFVSTVWPQKVPASDDVNRKSLSHALIARSARSSFAQFSVTPLIAAQRASGCCACMGFAANFRCIQVGNWMCGRVGLARRTCRIKCDTKWIWNGIIQDYVCTDAVAGVAHGKQPRHRVSCRVRVCWRWRFMANAIAGEHRGAILHVNSKMYARVWHGTGMKLDSPSSTSLLCETFTIYY